MLSKQASPASRLWRESYFTMQAGSSTAAQRCFHASSNASGHDNEPVARDAVQQASVRQTSCRRRSEHHRQASHAQTGPPWLHGAPGRQEEWATHPRIGRPGGSGALREDRAGLPSVCHLPACRTLPLPCALHGHVHRGQGRAGLRRCRGIGGPRWGPLLGWHHRLLGGGHCWRSSRRRHGHQRLPGGCDCWSGRRCRCHRSLSGWTPVLRAEGAHRRSRPQLVAGRCLHRGRRQARGRHQSVT